MDDRAVVVSSLPADYRCETLHDLFSKDGNVTSVHEVTRDSVCPTALVTFSTKAEACRASHRNKTSPLSLGKRMFVRITSTFFKLKFFDCDFIETDKYFEVDLGEKAVRNLLRNKDLLAKLGEKSAVGWAMWIRLPRYIGITFLDDDVNACKILSSRHFGNLFRDFFDNNKNEEGKGDDMGQKEEEEVIIPVIDLDFLAFLGQGCGLEKWNKNHEEVEATIDKDLTSIRIRVSAEKICYVRDRLITYISSLSKGELRVSTNIAATHLRKNSIAWMQRKLRKNKSTGYLRVTGKTMLIVAQKHELPSLKTIFQSAFQERKLKLKEGDVDKMRSEEWNRVLKEEIQDGRFEKPFALVTVNNNGILEVVDTQCQIDSTMDVIDMFLATEFCRSNRHEHTECEMIEGQSNTVSNTDSNEGTVSLSTLTDSGLHSLDEMEDTNEMLSEWMDTSFTVIEENEITVSVASENCSEHGTMTQDNKDVETMTVLVNDSDHFAEKEDATSEKQPDGGSQLTDGTISKGNTGLEMGIVNESSEINTGDSPGSQHADTHQLEMTPQGIGHLDTVVAGRVQHNEVDMNQDTTHQSNVTPRHEITGNTLGDSNEFRNTIISDENGRQVPPTSPTVRPSTEPCVHQAATNNTEASSAQDGAPLHPSHDSSDQGRSEGHWGLLRSLHTDQLTTLASHMGFSQQRIDDLRNRYSSGEEFKHNLVERCSALGSTQQLISVLVTLLHKEPPADNTGASTPESAPFKRERQHPAGWTMSPSSSCQDRNTASCNPYQPGLGSQFMPPAPKGLYGAFQRDSSSFGTQNCSPLPGSPNNFLNTAGIYNLPSPSFMSYASPNLHGDNQSYLQRPENNNGVSTETSQAARTLSSMQFGKCDELKFDHASFSNSEINASAQKPEAASTEQELQSQFKAELSRMEMRILKDLHIQKFKWKRKWKYS